MFQQEFERYSTDFDDHDLRDHFPPEDEETLIRTVGITKEVFESPKKVKLEHIDSAIESWQMLQSYLSDPHLSDLIGELIDLLGHVYKKRTLEFQDAERGREVLRIVVRFLEIPERRSPR